ncbi:MAG: SDR family NAD(P)-dependent oxidoreductase [Acidimicrobiales bacterium]
MAELMLEGQVAVVVGAGQTPGSTIGNGRATSLLLARTAPGCWPSTATSTAPPRPSPWSRRRAARRARSRPTSRARPDCRTIPEAALERFGRIDVLVNNVGIGTGDGGATSLDEAAWDAIFDVNLKGMWLTCKHVLPILRAQGSGSVVNISSVAAVCSVGLLAYKTSKAGVTRSPTSWR